MASRTVAFAGLVAVVLSAALWAISYLASHQREQAAGDRRWLADALETNLVNSRTRSSGHASNDDLAETPAALVRRSQPNRADSPRPPVGYTFTHVAEMQTKQRSMPEDRPTSPGKLASWAIPTIPRDTQPRFAGPTGRRWAFAWLERAPGLELPDLADTLRPHGASVVGASGTLVRVRLPVADDRLRAIAALPGVVALGALPAEHKVDARFAANARRAPADDPVPVFVTLMDSDQQGIWRRALERLGVVVGAWDGDLRAYSANLPPGILDDVLAADFVLAVEPVVEVRPAHDTAVPVMGADALRGLVPSTGLFDRTAGRSVPIGVMDTGLNASHSDVRAGRAGICGRNFIADEDYDLWLDRGRHGTHVTGTIAGAGAIDPLMAGVAPGVRHIRFAKVLSSYGSGSTAGITRAMDYLATASQCTRSGVRSGPARPLVVNMSLSQRGLAFSGRGVGERKLDATVWAHRQVYVVAQANAGVHGFSNYATAKNSLAVGAVADIGSIASFSSHGPTADGRLAPNVVATGIDVSSVRGSGHRAGYDSLNGTSMASPAVAGIAALLMDAEPRFRSQPALVRARIMASAVKPDAFLTSGRFPTNNTMGPGELQNRFGLGLASARLSVLQRDQPDGWASGAAVSEVNDGEYGYVDIDVPDGASRLDLVMTWDEAPADAIADSVLNDLDLWLDEHADCGAGACGEHHSLSRIDNIEWLILSQPPAGRHRVKVVARRVHGSPPRAAVAWTVVRGASTPRLRLEPASDVVRVASAEPVEIDLFVTVNGHVASGATMQLGYIAGGRKPVARVSREDGTVRTATVNDSVLSLGEIGTGERQRVTLSYPNTGKSHRVRLTASAWNAGSATAHVDVEVDGDPPQGEPPSAPANDDFVNATTITGRSGEHELELTLATREPGEPEVERELLLAQSRNEEHALQTFAKARSAWYSWRAPTTGQYTFRYPQRFQSLASMAVFEGTEIAALAQVGANRADSITFNATRDRLYRIRVATINDLHVREHLRWDGGLGRPPNDDFAHRERIAGSEGTVTGNNQEASLERREFLGEYAGSVWYEWTAPEDGHWTFSTSHGTALAFTGDAVSTLRLVSSVHGSPTFPTAAGAVYHIAVVAPSTETSGSAFELTWKPSDASGLADNDSFAAAAAIEGATGAADASLAPRATVEPGEPTITGTQTRWWSWPAPDAGRYTFRLVGRDAAAVDLSIFAGNALAELDWLGSGTEFVVDALPDEPYAVAVGRRYDSTFEPVSVDLSLVWGETPPNDRPAGASVLEGPSGSVSASHHWATTSAQETEVAGHSSLWWAWTAPQGGWYRFRLDSQDDLGLFGQSVLAIYRPGTGGNLDLVGTTDRSYVLSGRLETAVLASSGDRFLIQVAVRAWQPPGASTFGWEQSDPPQWLAIRDRLTHGETLPDGGLIELADPRSVAIDETGERLFVTAQAALAVFNRDVATGSLTAAPLVAYRDEAGNDLPWLSNARLHWDSEQAVLYAFNTQHSAAFRWPEEGTGTVEACTMEAVPGLRTYQTPPQVFGTGRFFYLVGPWSGVAVYRLDAPCDFTLVQILSHESVDHPSAERVPELTSIAAAEMGLNRDYLYLARYDALLTLERDAESGTLRLTSTISAGASTGEGVPVQFPTEASRVVSMAVDAAGDYLFVVGWRAPQTVVFDLRQHPDAPDFLNYTGRFYMDRLGFQTHFDYPLTGWVGSTRDCAAVVPRATGTVDVVCGDGAHVVTWDADDRRVVVTDWFGLGAPDRFGAETPEFGPPSQAVQSPNGAHVYAIATDWPHSLLTLQRAESMSPP